MSAADSAAAAGILLFLLLLAPPLHARTGYAGDVAFGRSSWLTELKLVGAASVVRGEAAVALTSNATDGIRAGRALFRRPVTLLLAQPRAAPDSFITQFRFRILPSPSYGDGIAFMLTSSATFLGASDGYLGLYPNPTANPGRDLHPVATVAVEFDTHRDAELGDRNGNHIALDTTSIVSVKSAAPGVNLKAGRPVSAWIEYRGPRHQIRAWVSYSNSHRPANPVLSAPVDIPYLFKNGSFLIGFAASNGQGTAVHIVDRWTFRSFTFRESARRSPSVPPPSLPPPSVPPSPALPPKSIPPHQSGNVLKAVVGGCVAFLGAVLFICCIIWICRRPLVRKKRKNGVQLTTLSDKIAMLPKTFERSSE